MLNIFHSFAARTQKDISYLRTAMQYPLWKVGLRKVVI